MIHTRCASGPRAVLRSDFAARAGDFFPVLLDDVCRFLDSAFGSARNDSGKVAPLEMTEVFDLAQGCHLIGGETGALDDDISRYPELQERPGSLHSLLTRSLLPSLLPSLGLSQFKPLGSSFGPTGNRPASCGCPSSYRPWSASGGRRTHILESGFQQEDHVLLHPENALEPLIRHHVDKCNLSHLAG